MFDFKLNDTFASSYGVFAISRPNIPAPEKRTEEKTVPGRHGSLICDENTYDAIQISIECNFMSETPEAYLTKWRKIKSWIFASFQARLSFSDDENFYYKVQKIQIGKAERLSRKIGKFSIVCFCDPFNYALNGLDEMDIPEELNNDYYTAQPIYKLQGEGIFVLNVNGYKFSVNVAQNCTIDTSLGIIFRDDNTIVNQTAEGNFEGLYLIEGKNTFAVQKPSEDATAKIIPNWRAL